MIPAFKTTLGYVPKEGSRALPVSLPFTAAQQQITFDSFLEQSQAQIEFIQSVYIDNSLNLVAVSFRFPGLQQVLTARSQTQGYYPLFLPNGRFSFTAVSQVNANTQVNVIFSNVFINPTVWSVI